MFRRIFQFNKWTCKIVSLTTPLSPCYFSVMIKSIAFIVYPVSDMARSRVFYESVLGLTPAYSYGDEWVEYDLGDSTFAITTTDMGHTPGALGAIVAFEVED